MSLAATIADVRGSSSLDSTGYPAIQCKIDCTVRNEIETMSSMKLTVGPEISMSPPLGEYSIDLITYMACGKFV